MKGGDTMSMIPIKEYVILTKDVMSRILDSGVLEDRDSDDVEFIKALIIILKSLKVKETL